MRNLTQAPLNQKSVYFNGLEIAAAVFFTRGYTDSAETVKSSHSIL